ncbi:MAG: divalent metal cation transporter [Nitrospinae bacterium]|nr:divalent metal cation transporter [Nitrospinota bacterium]
MNKKLRVFLQTLGPGLILAGTSIGVSHIVQSTRAGAEYGFALIGIILFANVIKYPFFEFGPRYATATGESLIEGYQRVGKWALPTFLVLTFLTMFTIQAGVTIVMAGLASNLFNNIISLSVPTWSLILLLFIGALLVIGRYPWLDFLMKGMIVVLGITTLIAFFSAWNHGMSIKPNFVQPEVFSIAGIAFVVALAGWMPSAVEISVWHSLWSVEQEKQTGCRPTMSESLFDFNFGYIFTVIYALVFLSLGAFILYGTGEKLPDTSVGFTATFINIYTEALGSWGWVIIAIAAFTTMFSTTLAVTDAYPRVWRRAVECLYPKSKKLHAYLYWIILVTVGGTALIIIFFLSQKLKLLIDFATTLSFLSAPLYAYINYRSVMLPNLPEGMKPPNWLKYMAWFGMVALSLFAVAFVIWRFFL